MSSQYFSQISGIKIRQTMSRFDFLIFIGNLDETKKTESTSTVSALKLTFILAQFHNYIFLSNWAKDEI
jgi:hypothetical protein